jgi:putative transposase
MKTFKYQLYNSKKNKYLDKQILLYAKLYNYCISLHKLYYKLYGKYPNPNKLKKHLTKRKKLKLFDWLNQLDAQAIQDVVERIDKGYLRFFDYCKKRKQGIKGLRRVSPPSFKKSFKYKSFTLKQICGYKFDNNSIYFGKLKKKFKFHKSRNWEGKIKTVTIKKQHEDYFIYITTDYKNINQTLEHESSNIVGFDFGLKMFLTGSDNTEIQSPLFFNKFNKDVRKANRNLSSKKFRSNNYHKTQKHLNNVHKKIGNCRLDFFFKLAKDLCEKYSIICLEDLNLDEMKKQWGRKVSDLAFYKFITILKYQASKTGTQIIQVDRYFSSSKLCSSCSYINNNLLLKDREWVCPNCGINHNRDKNAAINIKLEGLKTVGASTVRLNSIRQS